MREDHSSWTDDFEASAAAVAIGVRFDARGKPDGHDDLAAAATNSQWRYLRVAEAATG